MFTLWSVWRRATPETRPVFTVLEPIPLSQKDGVLSDPDAVPDRGRVLGVVEPGCASANEASCEGRDLPWLQDSPQSAMWESWGVVYRDVFILDSEGRLLEAYNLSMHDLAVDYDDLKGILEGYAAAQ